MIESLTTYRNACPKKGAIFDLYASPYDTHVIPFLVHFHRSVAEAQLISLKLERKMYLQYFYNNNASILQPRRSSQQKVKNTGWPDTHMENEPTWPSHTMKREHRTVLNFQMQISKRTNGTLIHYHISGSPPHFQFNPFLHSDGHLCDFWCYDYNTIGCEVTTIDVSSLYNRARGTEAASPKRSDWLNTCLT